VGLQSEYGHELSAISQTTGRRALLGQVTADRFQIRYVDAFIEPTSIGWGASIRIGAQREETRVPAGSKAQQGNLGSVEMQKMSQVRGAAALIRKLQ